MALDVLNLLNTLADREQEFIPIRDKADQLDPERAKLARKGELRLHFQISPDWADTTGMGYSVTKIRGQNPFIATREDGVLTEEELNRFQDRERAKYSEFESHNAAESAEQYEKLSKEGIFPAAISLSNLVRFYTLMGATGPAPNPEFFITVRKENGKIVDVVPYIMLIVTEKEAYQVSFDGLVVSSGRAEMQKGRLDKEFEKWMGIFQKLI